MDEELKRNEYHFVYVEDDSSMSRHRARAHTSKVNRGRQRQVSLRRKKPTNRSSIESSKPLGSWLGNERVKDDARVVAVSQISRTLSPVFGGFATDVFNPVSMSTSSRILHYNLTVIYPSLIHDAEILTSIVQDRMRLFCEYPTLFHSYHFTAAAHYDIARRQLDWYNSPNMIWHKMESIRHLREMIANLDQVSIEVAIVAVLYLDYGEITTATFEDGTYNPFDPPLPPVIWMEDTWNRIIPSEAHAEAIYCLVRLTEGLSALKLAGLAINLGRWDLRRASIHLAKPRFECSWPGWETLVYPRPNMQSSSTRAPGIGFETLIPNSLPKELVDSLLMVATVNEMMYDDAVVQTLGHRLLRDARSAVHHRLLCVSTWDELQLDHRGNLDRVSYECCRLTAIMYSNAVLLGIPPQTGWLDRLIPRLKEVLESTDMPVQAKRCPLLFAWVLALGGIISLPLGDEAYFGRRLKPILHASGLRSWQAVKEALSCFLWSDRACGRGAAALWTSMAQDSNPAPGAMH